MGYRKTLGMPRSREDEAENAIGYTHCQKGSDGFSHRGEKDAKKKGKEKENGAGKKKKTT